MLHSIALPSLSLSFLFYFNLKPTDFAVTGVSFIVAGTITTVASGKTNATDNNSIVAGGKTAVASEKTNATDGIFIIAGGKTAVSNGKTNDTDNNSTVADGKTAVSIQCLPICSAIFTYSCSTILTMVLNGILLAFMYSGAVVPNTDFR